MAGRLQTFLSLHRTVENLPTSLQNEIRNVVRPAMRPEININKIEQPVGLSFDSVVRCAVFSRTGSFA